MKARTQYKPPKLKKPPKIPPRDPNVDEGRKNGVNGVRFMEVGADDVNGNVSNGNVSNGNVTNGNGGSFNGNGKKLNGRTVSRRNPPAWDNTVDVPTQGDHRTRTGLKFVPSSRGPMNGKKPVTRKVAHARSGVVTEEDTNRAVPYYSDVKTRKTSSIRKYKFEDDAYLAGINQPNQYLAGINQPKQVKRSNIKKKLSANCNECGSDYPIEKARFCCMCGVKRLYVDV